MACRIIAIRFTLFLLASSGVIVCEFLFWEKSHCFRCGVYRIDYGRSLPSSSSSLSLLLRSHVRSNFVVEVLILIFFVHGMLKSCLLPFQSRRDPPTTDASIPSLYWKVKWWTETIPKRITITIIKEYAVLGVTVEQFGTKSMELERKLPSTYARITINLRISVSSGPVIRKIAWERLRNNLGPLIAMRKKAMNIPFLRKMERAIMFMFDPTFYLRG